MEPQLKTQAINAAIVNISGRRRMLSQRASMLCLMMANAQTQLERASVRSTLQNVSSAMETAHQGLIYGDAELNLPGKPSATVRRMYFEAPIDIDRQIRDFLGAIHAFLQLPDSELSLSHPHLQTITQLASTHLLAGLEAVVAQYQSESDAEQSYIEAQQLELYQQSCAAAHQAKVEASKAQQALAELRHTQSRLIQTEKMSALGQLVAGIAHELNNPTTFIHGNIEHLRAYTQDMMALIQAYGDQYPESSAVIQRLTEQLDLEFMAEDVQRLFTSVTTGVRRINNIVLSLRSFSRLDEAALKRVDVHKDIENVLLLLNHRIQPPAPQASITISRHYGQLPLLECYPKQLNQALMNLLSNAIDAVERQPDTEKEIIIQTRLVNDETIAIHVIDNGIGIPKELASKVFDPFFTTKPVGGGTGLGLSVSYQIITQTHRGQLSFNATADAGTEFVVALPIRVDASILASA